MGVRGFTTFVATRGSRCLSHHELHSCTLVVDGSSLAAQLFVRHKGPQDAFGGDYFRYAKKVREFFALLRRCRVRALVVIDGGCERRKLGTAMNRMRERWIGAASVSPADVTSSTCPFPPMLKDTFKAILIELDVPMVQSLFEADAVVAALARRLQCPVLSYDSDFFVYGVMYVPFPSVSVYPSKRGNNNFYLQCKLFTMEQLVKAFGGLNPDLMPLVAVLLGNDFISKNVFKTFVMKLKHTKGKSQRKSKSIEGLLRWLREETLESATAKVVGCFPIHKRHSTTVAMQKAIKAYQGNSCAQTEKALEQLAAFLGIDLPLPPNHPQEQGERGGSNHTRQGCEKEATVEVLSNAGLSAEDEVEGRRGEEKEQGGLCKEEGQEQLSGGEDEEQEKERVMDGEEEEGEVDEKEEEGELDEEEEEGEVDEEEEEGEVDEEEEEGELDEEEEEGELDEEEEEGELDEEEEVLCEEEDKEGEGHKEVGGSDLQRGGVGRRARILRKSLSTWEERRASKLPSWFLDCFQRGLFPSSFMDIYVLQVYFSPTMVEDVEELPAHATAATIVFVLMCLLLCDDSTKRRGLRVRWFMRGNKQGLHCVAVDDIRRMRVWPRPPPPLPALPLLSARARERLLLAAVSAPSSRLRRALRALPPRWRLFGAACRAFASAVAAPAAAAPHPSTATVDVTSASPSTVAALVDALLLSLVALSVEERHRPSFKEQSEGKGALSHADANDACDSNSEQEEGDRGEGAALEGLLEMLSPAEMASARKKLSSLFVVQEQLKAKPKLFCTWTVHLVACFQSTFLHLRHLNALLRYPWPDLPPQRALCCTFVYNAFGRLQPLSAAERGAWVGRLLASAGPSPPAPAPPSPAPPAPATDASRVLALFEALRVAMGCVLPPELLLEAAADHQVVCCRKKASRRKRKKKNLLGALKVAPSQSSPPFNSEEEGGDGEDKYEDTDNRFAALALSCD